MSTDTVIVLDFETTGMSPNNGDRPIEVGAVRIEGDLIVDRFQALMNPGFPVSWFIERLTGIGNDLIAAAQPCEVVMARFADWIGQTPLVAHNAGFDRAFLDAELALLGRERTNAMTCSMLAARRLIPDAPDHKLATLVRHLGIYTDGTFHRALADAEMTGHLWIAMTDLLQGRHGLTEVPFPLMQELGRMAKTRVREYLRSLAARQQVSSMARLFTEARP